MAELEYATLLADTGLLGRPMGCVLVVLVCSVAGAAAGA